MERYGTFRPTPFDHAGAFLPDRADWYLAPVSRTRDSGPIADTNFDAALEALGGESDTVEVHHFGHWGPGWFELILIDPADEERVAIGEELERSLADYPVLDDDAYSEREFEEACDAWANTSRRDRIRILARHHCSIFAARRDDIPQGLPYFDDFYSPND